MKLELIRCRIAASVPLIFIISILFDKTIYGGIVLTLFYVPVFIIAEIAFYLYRKNIVVAIVYVILSSIIIFVYIVDYNLGLVYGGNDHREVILKVLFKTSYVFCIAFLHICMLMRPGIRS